MSDKDTYRLADSTAVEPLINSWLAWSDTISPAPYSMHLVHYQLKTLNSYLSSPEAHVKASRNPKFMGLAHSWTSRLRGPTRLNNCWTQPRNRNARISNSPARLRSSMIS